MSLFELVLPFMDFVVMFMVLIVVVIVVLI